MKDFHVKYLHAEEFVPFLGFHNMCYCSSPQRIQTYIHTHVNTHTPMYTHTDTWIPFSDSVCGVKGKWSDWGWDGGAEGELLFSKENCFEQLSMSPFSLPSYFCIHL